jgi:cytochrome c553
LVKLARNEEHPEMNRLLISMTLSLLGLSIAAPTAFAEPNLENGKTKFVVCEACHGPTGSGSKEIGAPRIAGQNHWYELRQLRNFKAGLRGVNPEDTFGVVMRPMSFTLASDQDIEDVVAYFGTLKPEILPTTVTGGDVPKGKEIFTICAACHGDDGKGIEVLSAPRLAGIPDWYLLRQINNKGHPRDARGRHLRPPDGHHPKAHAQGRSGQTRRDRLHRHAAEGVVLRPVAECESGFRPIPR